MTSSTRYWVDTVKKITIELGKMQKLKSKYAHLLKRREKGSPQYNDVQAEIERLDNEICSHKCELLAIKCASLSTGKLSKSAKKAGFVTNGAYRKYIVEQFMQEYQSHYKEWSFEDFYDNLAWMLTVHMSRERSINKLEKQKRTETRVDYDGNIEYHDPQETYSDWVSHEEYEKKLGWYDEPISVPKDFFGVMDSETAIEVERRTR